MGLILVSIPTGIPNDDPWVPALVTRPRPRSLCATASCACRSSAPSSFGRSPRPCSPLCGSLSSLCVLTMLQLCAALHARQWHSRFFALFDDAAGVLAPLACLLYWWVIPTARSPCHARRIPLSCGVFLLTLPFFYYFDIRVCARYVAILPSSCDAPQQVSPRAPVGHPAY